MAKEAIRNNGAKRPKIRVSQSTIDDIKKMGMTQALKRAGQNAGAEQGGLVAEFAEGVRRMYGDTRYQNAAYKAASSPGPIRPKPQQKMLEYSPYGFQGFQAPKSKKK